jgi:hypothetical protein
MLMSELFVVCMHEMCQGAFDGQSGHQRTTSRVARVDSVRSTRLFLPHSLMMTSAQSTHTAGLAPTEHNAAMPLCRLPHETLVSIFKLVQRAHAPRIHNHSVSWGITDTKWRHMLSVCVHLRKTRYIPRSCGRS